MNGATGNGGSSFGDRLSLALRLMFLLFWAVLLGTLAAVAWSARNSDDIVIERIEAPPEMVDGGLKDEALARRILHELTVMRAQTADPVRVKEVSMPAASWLRDYRVEVPQTGLSVADLYVAFRRWFGRDIHVRGGVYKAPETGEPMLSLWVRGEATVRKLHLDRALEPQIAEHIYAASYPSRHAYWVSGDLARIDEAIDRLRFIAFNNRSSEERALALYSLAIVRMEVQGKCEEAVELLLRARATDPALPTVLGNLSNAYYCLGRDQAAADATREELRMLHDRGVEVDRRRRRALDLENRILLAGALGHHFERLRLYKAMEAEGFGFKRPKRAIVLAETKDFPASMALLKAHLAPPLKGPEPAWLCYKYFETREEWSQAAVHIRAHASAHATRRDPYIARQLATQIRPLEAIALARSGRFAEADAALASSGGRDCYLCARSRAAVVEARRRDSVRRGAAQQAKGLADEVDRVYARAVALAPRLPAAYLEWGRAKLDRGDIDGAIFLFGQAARHGPRSSEPLKYRADALARKGDVRRAASSYARAAKFAPRWFALHHAWSRALARLGREEAAAAKASEAAGMMLAARDLDWLTRTCAAHSQQLSMNSASPPAAN